MKILILLGVLLGVAHIQAEFDVKGVVDIKNDVNERIVGGSPAAQNQFPFMVRLQVALNTTTVLCSGSLISTRFVLTAATCMTGARSVRVFYGNVAVIANDPSSIETFVYTIHPEYNVTTLRNDLAIVDLLTFLPISASVRPVVIPRMKALNATFVDVNATVAGWGRNSDDGPLASALRYTNMTPIANEQCTTFFGPAIVGPSTICAVGSARPSDGTCRGDGGSPLFVFDRSDSGEWMQIGVTSFISTAGCSSTVPNGFVRPHYYWSWINAVTGVPIRS